MRVKLRGSRGARGIASAEYYDERNTAGPDGIDHPPVPPADPFLGDGKFAVAIAGSNIHARKIERNVGT